MLDLSHDIDFRDDAALLFANDDWQVLADGLEHRGTGYFIARSEIGARRGDGLWTWPMQLAEKSWCTPRLFREAFTAALEHFTVDRDEFLARSFAIGFGTRVGGSTSGEFVALGELIRTKPNARKRPVAGEGPAAARGRTRLPARVAARA